MMADGLIRCYVICQFASDTSTTIEHPREKVKVGSTSIGLRYRQYSLYTNPPSICWDFSLKGPPYPALTMLICWFGGKISTSIYKTLGHCVITSCNGKAGLFKVHFVFWYFFMEVYDSIRKRHICVVSITDNILIL